MNSTVTFGVIAYNEHRYLPDLLNDLVLQTYDKKLIEVILIDGESTDDTRMIMEEFAKKNKDDYKNIIVLSNPKKYQPAGWNVVIKNFSSDILLRIDAHARLPKDFIERNVNCLSSGESVCGGPRENIIDENTPWKKTLLSAEQSMFGAGIASYRKETSTRKYVKSVFHGAYKREVINEVGLFNEDLIRTEDNEYHYRIAQLGYKICYDPQIKSYYQTRSSLKGMLRQKYLNGLWIGRTLFVCPGCISIFHLVPFAFVMSILLTSLLALCGIKWLAIVLWFAYAVANLLMTYFSFFIEKGKSIFVIFLPIIFALLHICYGVGTVVGILYKKKNG